MKTLEEIRTEIDALDAQYSRLLRSPRGSMTNRELQSILDSALVVKGKLEALRWVLEARQYPARQTYVN